jgi:hypothetical protein
MVSTIDERDIESIAKRINIKLNSCQVNRVWHLFQYEEECNNTKDWEYIVQDCIIQIVTT